MSSSPFAVCPDQRLLLAFAAGTVSPEQLVGLQGHLVDCSACMDAIVLAAQTLDAASGQPGHAVGSYLLTGIVGHGGMGIVHSARNLVTGEPAAVKMVRSLKSNRLEGLRHEIGTLRDLRHPQIVRILDHDLSCADPWYAMELLVGETLTDRFLAIWGAENTGRGWAGAGRLLEILGLLRDLCRPLSFIHRAGIVHCDLKPDNIFLRDRKQVVLTDFGLIIRAQGTIGRELINAGGLLRGTIPYLSPEVISGQLPDARADLYAFGCILYEGVTGRPPFVAPTPDEVLALHLNEVPIPASTLVHGVPSALEHLLARLLSKSPMDRFGHIEEVEAELTRILQGQSEQNAPPVMRLFRPSMIGREELLRRARAVCDEAMEHKRGAFLAVEGESGIGKTFFANEVCRNAARAGLGVVVGECLSVAAREPHPAEVSSAPLAAFRTVLEAVADRCRERGVEQAAALLDWRLPVLAAYEPSLAQLPTLPGTAQVTELPGAASRERLVAAIKDALAMLARKRPLLLAIDDLQWADDLSLAVLSALDDDFFASVPVIVMGIYRSEDARDVIREIANRAHSRRLHVGRLNASEIARLVGGMLSIPDPHPSLVRYLNMHSEGVPFFVAEYLRAVVAEGLLARGNGRWVLNPSSGAPEQTLASVSLPTSLAGLVRRRLASLTASDMEVLQLASVIGRNFGHRSLALMCAASSEQSALAENLQRLVARELIESTLAGNFRFVHDKIREAVYGDLSAEQRQNLHEKAASALEQDDEETPLIEKHYGELAYHFRMSERPARALDYLEKAALRALQLSANADAAAYLREAIVIESTLPQSSLPLRRARFHRLLGDALQGLGRISESAAPLQHAATALGCEVPEHGWKLGGLVAYHASRQALRAGRERWRQASAQDLAIAAERGRILDRLQRVYFYTGQDFPLLLTTISTLNLAGQTRELAIAYAHAALIAALLNMNGRATHYFAEAVAILDRQDDPSARCEVESLRGLHAMVVGRVREGIPCVEQALLVAEKVAFFRGRDEALSIRGAMEIVLGEAALAKPWVDALAASAAKRNDAQLVCWSHLQRAQCWNLIGDHDSAMACVMEARSMLSSLARPEKIWTYGMGAYLSLASNDLAEARSSVDEAARLLAMGSPGQSYCLDAYAKIAEVELALTSRGAASRDLARAARLCSTLAMAARMFPIAGPSSLFQRGALEWLRGRPGKAHALWHKAATAAASMQLRYDEARILRTLAETSALPSEREALQLRVSQLCLGLALHDIPRHAVLGHAATSSAAKSPPTASVQVAV